MFYQVISRLILLLLQLLCSPSFYMYTVHMYRSQQKVPLFANLRCGLWYLSPRELEFSKCYFKSSDGHTHHWQFNLRRLNLQVAEAVSLHGGMFVFVYSPIYTVCVSLVREWTRVWCGVVWCGGGGCSLTKDKTINRNMSQTLLVIQPPFLWTAHGKERDSQIASHEHFLSGVVL